jgi:hypothetical protein
LVGFPGYGRRLDACNDANFRHFIEGALTVAVGVAVITSIALWAKRGTGGSPRDARHPIIRWIGLAAGVVVLCAGAARILMPYSIRDGSVTTRCHPLFDLGRNLDNDCGPKNVVREIEGVAMIAIGLAIITSFTLWIVLVTVRRHRTANP